MKAGLPQYMLASGGKTGSAAGGVVKPQVTKSMTSEEKFLKDQERKEKESIAYHALHNPDGSKKTDFQLDQERKEKESIAYHATHNPDGSKKTKAARGAFIVNKPTYLPRSGTIVGESTSWTGKIPDGGPEAVIGGAAGGAVIPMASPASDIFVKKFAKEILNELMFARIGSDGAEATSSPNIVDASTNTNVTNNTIIRTPSPSGPNLHFEGRDFVHKIA